MFFGGTTNELWARDSSEPVSCEAIVVVETGSEQRCLIRTAIIQHLNNIPCEEKVQIKKSFNFHLLDVYDMQLNVTLLVTNLSLN